MKLNKSFATAAFAVAACLSPLALHATTITFEEVGDVGLVGPTVTNQYPGVVFSSTVGFRNVITSQNNIGFGLNFLCTAFNGGFLTCTNETILTFTAPVSGLSFYAVGSDDAGNTASVDVFVNNAFAATLPISTNGIFDTPNFVDLSAFSKVTSIRLYNITDGGGLGWDNFTFTPGRDVPDGGSTVCLLGFVLLGLAAVRRKLSC
jgi:hypothetical protein